MTSAGAKLLGISTPGTEKILEGRAHVLLKACISPECHMLCNRGTMHNLETFLTCPLVPTCQRISKRADDDNEGKGHGSAFWCFSIAVVKFYDDAFFDEASWKTWHNCHRLLWQQTWFSPFCACTITQVPCNPAPSAPFFFFFLWALARRMVQLVCAVCAWNILSSSQAIIQTVACRYWGTGYLTSPQWFFFVTFVPHLRRCSTKFQLLSDSVCQRHRPWCLWRNWQLRHFQIKSFISLNFYLFTSLLCCGRPLWHVQ